MSIKKLGNKNVMCIIDWSLQLRLQLFNGTTIDERTQPYERLRRGGVQEWQASEKILYERLREREERVVATVL